MKFFINTFGCQMNKLDSELIAGELLRQGYQAASSEAEADIILFNTCSVRQHAEEKVYSRLSALKPRKQASPDLIIGLVGCMAQKDKDSALKRVPFLDIVCGPHRYQRIPGLIKEIETKRQSLICADEEGLINDGRYQRNPALRPNKFQAYVNVIRGCDNFCSYCVVPYVRGREISLSIKEIVDEAKQLVDDGCKEITLLGQNVTSYGRSLGKDITLVSLLTELDKIPNLKRLRFITSHPAFVTDELFRAMRDLPRVCSYLHMPAQSGSNKIIRAMNRNYTAENYLALITRAREIVPEVEIASDFIVGFPGETEEDFRSTADLIKEARFLNCFVFKYSPRPGTRAAELSDDIPTETKRERNNLLLGIQSRIAQARHEGLIGKIVEILVEGRSKNRPQRQTGLTRNSYRVMFESGQSLTGELVKVKINRASALTLYGELIQ
jgi:tRNA-2-methylthio-N6-dimethylallyladenosine synthase